MSKKITNYKVVDTRTVYETTDYSMFKVNENNRQLSESNVRDLMTAITINNLLIINPVIISDAKWMIDGHHRLEACKRLNKPINFIMIDMDDPYAPQSMSSAGSNWSQANHFEAWVARGKPEYIKLKTLLDEYKFIKLRWAIRSLSDGSSNKSVFSTGNMVLKNVFHFRTVGNAATKLYNVLVTKTSKTEATRIVNDRMLTCLHNLINVLNVDEKPLLEKLIANQYKLYPCTTNKQVIGMIEKIVNYNSRKPVDFGRDLVEVGIYLK